MSNRRKRKVQRKFRYKSEIEVPGGKPWPKIGGVITVQLGEEGETCNALVMYLIPTDTGTLRLGVATPVPVRQGVL